MRTFSFIGPDVVNANCKVMTIERSLVLTTIFVQLYVYKSFLYGDYFQTFVVKCTPT